MGIKCGIVSLPNVGKSTLFNALTRAQIAAENYPFCTIDTNVGVVHVPDARIEVINTELALADLDTVERGLQRAEKASKAGDKDAIRQRELLKKLRDHLDAGKPARSCITDPEEKKLLNELH